MRAVTGSDGIDVESDTPPLLPPTENRLDRRPKMVERSRLVAAKVAATNRGKKRSPTALANITRARRAREETRI